VNIWIGPASLSDKATEILLQNLLSRLSEIARASLELSSMYQANKTSIQAQNERRSNVKIGEIGNWGKHKEVMNLSTTIFSSQHFLVQMRLIIW
jgi:hypothetical protein